MNRGVFYNSLLGCPDISFMGGGVSENADARQKMQQGWTPCEHFQRGRRVFEPKDCHEMNCEQTLMPRQIKKPPAFRRPVPTLMPIQINQTNTAQHIINIVWVCIKPNACLHKSGGLRPCKGRLKGFQTAFAAFN